MSAICFPPRSRRPLLHIQQDISPPWDDFPVRLEVIAVAETLHLGDVSARERQLPELDDSANPWIELGCHGPLTIYARTVDDALPAD